MARTDALVEDPSTFARARMILEATTESTQEDGPLVHLLRENAASTALAPVSRAPLMVDANTCQLKGKKRASPEQDEDQMCFTQSEREPRVRENSLRPTDKQKARIGLVLANGQTGPMEGDEKVVDERTYIHIVESVDALFEDNDATEQALGWILSDVMKMLGREFYPPDGSDPEAFLQSLAAQLHANTMCPTARSATRLKALCVESQVAFKTFRATGNAELVDGLIKELQDFEISASTARLPFLRSFTLDLLASNLWVIFRYTSNCDISYLNESIARFEEASLGRAHEQLSPVLMILLAALMSRFIFFKDLEDLDRAIDLYTQAKGNTPDWVWRPLLLSMLRSRVAYWDGMGHLKNASDGLKELIELTPMDDPARTSLLVTLATFEIRSSTDTSDWSWNPSDVDETIAILKQAMDALPPDDLAGETGDNILFCLSQSLYLRFRRNNNRADLNEALYYSRKNMATATAPQMRVAMQIDLARGLTQSGRQFNDIEQLAEAASILCTCRDMIPPQDTDFIEGVAMALMRLALAIVDLGVPKNRDPNLEPIWGLPHLIPHLKADLKSAGVPDSAFQATSRSIREAFGFDPETPTDNDILSLGDDASGLERFDGEKTHIRDSLASAMLGGGKIEWPDPPSDSISPKEMILLLENASAFHSEDDARAQSGLAEGYWMLHWDTQDSTYADAALFHQTLALRAERSPQLRLEKAEKCLLFAGRTSESCDFFDPTLVLEIIIDSISQLAGLEATVDKRHRVLRRCPWEVRFASGLVIAAGELQKALEWLERGRGLVWNQLKNLRTPLDDLRSHSPVIADRLAIVSQGLDTAGSREERGLKERLSGTEAQQIAFKEQETTRVKLAQEYEDILQTVRTTIPGFESFLQPLSSTEWLQNLPTSGPVVLINVSVYCDAIALIPGLSEPRRIHLADFSYSKAEELQDRLRSALMEISLLRRENRDDLDEGEDRAIRPLRKRSQSQVLASVLRELWTLVVKPVLDALEFSRSEQPAKRIWWCPTGALTSLPLHAAGIYEDAHPESVLDYAISSYIPTISTVTERVKRSKQAHANNVKICMVSQPEAPGLPRIPGTKDEVARIAGVFSDPSISAQRLEDGAATKEAALEAMEGHSWIHLACHGCQNSEQPLKSGFALANGRLELASIIKYSLKNAEFAFLSACQTSTGDITLSDESVHLAAAMLVTGYLGVVGTMWSIDDRHAPEVAEDFYREVLARSEEVEGRKRLDAEQAVYALHHAVQRLRRRVGDSNYLIWVPYVHFGL